MSTSHFGCVHRLSSARRTVIDEKNSGGPVPATHSGQRERGAPRDFPWSVCKAQPTGSPYLSTLLGGNFISLLSVTREKCLGRALTHDV